MAQVAYYRGRSCRCGRDRELDRRRCVLRADAARAFRRPAAAGLDCCAPSFAWPFALGQLQGEAAAHVCKVNKALVAFLACLIVAVAAISVATNLARVSR